MKFFDRYWFLKYAGRIYWALLALAIIISVWFWNTPEQSKASTLLGGLAAGLILAFVQYMFSWREYKERAEIRLLGLKNVLETKRDRAYYGKLIKGAKKEIRLIGKTAFHFLEDFANRDGSHKEATFLLEALGRGVSVRFLLPCPDRLSPSDKGKANASKKRLDELKLEFNDFSYRYFDHEESHSFFLADDEVIIGPFFPHLASMDTPALHLDRSATLPQKYIEYFDAEWKRNDDQA